MTRKLFSSPRRGTNHIWDNNHARTYIEVRSFVFRSRTSTWPGTTHRWTNQTPFWSDDWGGSRICSGSHENVAQKANHGDLPRLWAGSNDGDLTSSLRQMWKRLYFRLPLEITCFRNARSLLNDSILCQVEWGPHALANQLAFWPPPLYYE